MKHTRDSYSVLCDDIKSIVDCYIQIMQISGSWCDSSMTAEQAMLTISRIIFERQKESYQKVMGQNVKNENVNEASAAFADLMKGPAND